MICSRSPDSLLLVAGTSLGSILALLQEARLWVTCFVSLAKSGSFNSLESMWLPWYLPGSSVCKPGGELF